MLAAALVATFKACHTTGLPAGALAVNLIASFGGTENGRGVMRNAFC
jgi:hypothetical protein